MVFYAESFACMRTFCYEYYNLELYQAYILLRRYNAWRVYGLVSTLHMRLKIVCRPTAREALFLINHIYIPFIFIMHATFGHYIYKAYFL